MYGKIVDGVLQNPPEEIRRSIQAMKDAGFKPVIDSKPSYDVETQDAIFVDYMDTGAYIRAMYEIVEIEPTEEEQNTEEEKTTEEEKNELDEEIPIEETISPEDIIFDDSYFTETEPALDDYEIEFDESDNDEQKELVKIKNMEFEKVLDYMAK